MPAVPSASNSNARRNSFYGRNRASSSGSSSSTSSHGQNVFNSTSSSSSSTSTSKTTSSAQRSSSPLSKKQAAIAAAANAASKRLLVNTNSGMNSNNGSSSDNKSNAKKVHSDSLRSEVQQGGRSYIDEPEYHDEVLKHMHFMEEETTACVDLMDAQPELRWYMRPYLVDFIVEIHQTFRLRSETLFLTMNIVDRYVSKRIVYKRHYQLVGCAALLIAAKFEDAKDKVPLVSELAQMCCNAYDESAFVQMEGHVLSTIGWTLGFPTPEAWLRLSCAMSKEDAEDEALFTVNSINLDSRTLNMARFLLEVTLFTRDFIGLTPSNLTAGCLLLARIIANNGQNKRALTSVASPKAIQAAQIVDAYLIEHAHELSEILVKKYSFSHFGCASTAIVQWYITFVAQRDAQRSILGQANVSPLLPAVCFTASAQVVATASATTSSQSANSVGMTKSSSSSSFSTPRRSAEDMQDDDEDDEERNDDDNISMRSRSTTPSSMISTPSQMSTDGEDDDDEDEDEDHSRDEEDEESDMPVTPLSLNSLHDPLVATEVKENNANAKVNSTNANKAVVKATADQHLQPRNDRRALSLSQQDNRLMLA
ncbi:hypothetical protein L7F22_052653 [Adiantum nelumboides]|nr:hypothetical protein [Adiantum nelumboides]